MHIARPPSLLLVLVAGFWFATGHACVAQEEVKFPEKSPLVSFAVPDDNWIVDPESKGDLPSRQCTCAASVTLTVFALRDACSDADFQQKLPAFARLRSMARGVDEKSPDFVSGPTTKLLLGDKIPAVRYEAKCKVLDAPYQVVAYGFTVDGKSMLVICGWQEVDRQFTAGFDKILHSFKPLK